MYTNEEGNKIEDEVKEEPKKDFVDLKFNDDKDFDDKEVNVKVDNNGSGSSKIKYIIIIVLVIILGVIGLLINSKKNATPKLSSTQEALTINNKANLTLTSSDKVTGIEWKSDNENIAKVNGTGGAAEVEAVGYGKANINVSFVNNGNRVVLTCVVTVTGGDSNTALQTVKFADGALLLGIGKEYKLVPSFEPSNGYINNVKYTASDMTIVNVDAAGVVKGLKAGTTDVTLTVNDNLNATIKVYVVDSDAEPGIVVVPTSIKFKENNPKEVEAGEKITLEVEVEPSGASDKVIEWITSDEKIAKVSNGEVTGVGEGKVTITAKFGDQEVKEEITVKGKEVKPTGITVTEETLEVKIGNTGTISYTLEPSDVTDKEVTFKSSDTSIAMVDTNGVVTGVAAGECKITITASGDNSITKEVTIKVS